MHCARQFCLLFFIFVFAAVGGWLIFTLVTAGLLEAGRGLDFSGRTAASRGPARKPPRTGFDP